MRYNLKVTMKSGKVHEVVLGDSKHTYDYRQWLNDTLNFKSFTIDDIETKSHLTIMISEIESIIAKEIE